MKPLRVLWCVFVLVLLCFHLLIGALVAIATAFYWLFEQRLQSNPQSKSILSETREIQTAFQRGMAELVEEMAVKDGLSTGINPATIQPNGIIDGAKLLDSFDSNPSMLSEMGLSAEQIRVLKTMTFLLSQCARLEATKQNVEIFKPLFNPAKPTTPLVADAYEDVVRVVTRSIEPTWAKVKS